MTDADRTDSWVESDDTENRSDDVVYVLAIEDYGEWAHRQWVKRMNELYGGSDA